MGWSDAARASAARARKGKHHLGRRRTPGGTGLSHAYSHSTSPFKQHARTARAARRKARGRGVHSPYSHHVYPGG